MNVSLRSIVAVALTVAAVPAFAAVFEEDAVPGRSPQEQIQELADARLLGPAAPVASGVVASVAGEPTSFGLDARLFPSDADPGRSPTEAVVRSASPAPSTASGSAGEVSQACSCDSATNG